MNLDLSYQAAEEVMRKMHQVFMQLLRRLSMQNF